MRRCITLLLVAVMLSITVVVGADLTSDKNTSAKQLEQLLTLLGQPDDAAVSGVAISTNRRGDGAWIIKDNNVYTCVIGTEVVGVRCWKVDLTKASYFQTLVPKSK